MPAEAQIPLKDAADRFGVSLDTLRRRQKSGELPEAVLVPGPSGDQWILPEHALAEIAERNSWIIDLREDAPASAEAFVGQMPKHQVAIEGEIVEARVALARAEAREDASRAETDRQKAKIRQLESDLEVERVERERLLGELAGVRGELGVAEALVGERGELVSRLEEVQAERVVEIGVLRERAVRAEMDARAVRESLGWWARRRLARNQAVSD